MVEPMRSVLLLLLVVVVQLGLLACCCNGNFVFNVERRFSGPVANLTALKDHDVRRHGRLLAASAVDIPLGGNGLPSSTGLYYTKIGLGNPSNEYYVQVDTGSDILWVNCIDCTKCPKKSDLGVKLSLYDPLSSSSSSQVECSADFCTSLYGGELSGCSKNVKCEYKVLYGDGSETSGYFVKDQVQLDGLSGNFQTSKLNGSVIFGCGAQQSGELGSSAQALDGIIGFGQSNSSLLSQLSLAGKVPKVFSHCLDSVNGGGIFTIGEVVSPKFNTTPIVPNQSHYNVVLKDIDVDGTVLDLPSDVFDTGDRTGTIVDSGTTLAYLPEVVYEAVMTKIMAKQPDLTLHTFEDQFQCVKYTGKVDDGFPDVTFHFKNLLTLTVHPHDYLFQVSADAWCFGWQNSALQSKDSAGMTLLGDLVLSNKLVVYDLENQVIGWTPYNCSSSIQVKDGSSGTPFSVGAGDLSSATNLVGGGILGTFLLLVFAILHRLT